MIKCGTIAAIVIAGSAAGTATLVSDPGDTERVAASGQSATEQSITTRGTRSSLAVVDASTAPIGDQPRRGERPEYQPASLTIAALPDEDMRRGTR